jgi:tRNA-dihydrouridine synthase
MDDVTDTVFRQMVQKIAEPDLFFTEFVNVDGLMSPGRSKLLPKLKFDKSETKLVAQLWGLKPENFEAVADQIASGELAKELGLPDGYNFVGVDLNMGCPAKSEVQNGACSALIKPENRDLADDIIEATRRGLKSRLPLSVKTRLGFNEVDMTWFEFLLGKELDTLTVHGRTRKEMSKVPAHWDLIGEVVKLRDKLARETLIIGNGDVENRQQGTELAERYGLDGIMIGRGIFHNPFVFSEDGSLNWQKMSPTDKIELYKRHVELFRTTWSGNTRPIRPLNKFCKMYIQGFDGAKELREQLMQVESVDELLHRLETATQAIKNPTA